MKLILGVFDVWIVNSAFRCNPMSWLITMKCCGTTEFCHTIDDASFGVLMCLASEVPHSGAIPCAMIGWKFH